MRKQSLTLLFAFCGAMAAGVACSSNNGYRPDAHADGLTYDVSLDLPPGCPPAQPNAKGVGSPCTRGGHQCTNGLLCACDTNLGLTLNGVPCICTVAGLNPQPSNPDPCSTQSAGVCGTGATCCNYMNQAFYCSPDVCLPNGKCLEFTNGGG